MKKILLTLAAAIVSVAASAQQTLWVWQNGQPVKVENVDSVTYAPQQAAKPDYRDFTVNGVTFRMIYVKGGSYYRGAQTTDPTAPGYVTDSLRGTSEQPVYNVNISDFYMQETECTQALWLALFPTYAWFGTKGDNKPVNGQMYSEMLVFIDSLNSYLHANNQIAADEKFTIPTESQWEWAARGGVKSQGYRFAGSNDVAEVAWYNKNSGYTLHDVKQLKPNELGLYDMSGNALEACSDNFYDDYSWATDNMTDPTGSTAPYNKHGITERAYTRRGGGYAHPDWRQTVTKRDFYDVSYDVNGGASEDMGFRLILK